MSSRRVLGALMLLSGIACAERAPRTQDSAIAAPVDSVTASITSEPLRALGTEPFWALDVDSGGLKFITPEDTSGVRFPPIAHTVVGDTVVWSGQRESATIEARVWLEKCSDGMSDRVYPYAARVTVAGTEYRGCANQLRAIMEASRP
jgi:uncharacterized membrane protein